MVYDDTELIIRELLIELFLHLLGKNIIVMH